MFVNFKGPPASSHKAAIVPTVCELSNIVCSALLTFLMPPVSRLELFKVTVTDANVTARNLWIMHPQVTRERRKETNFQSLSLWNGTLLKSLNMSDRCLKAGPLQYCSMKSQGLILEPKQVCNTEQSLVLVNSFF